MSLVNLQTEILLLEFLSRTIYYIILFQHIFLFQVCFLFHAITSRRISQNVYKNIILIIYEYYIALKYQYRYLGPV
jgi:hypothetical protein